MRWTWVGVLCVACGGAGRATLDVVPSDTDPPLTRDGTWETDEPADSGTPQDTAPVGSANDCGPWVTPPASALGAPSVVYVGHAVTTDNAWTPSWHGCEVERHFDANGRFVCEIWRDADGPGVHKVVAAWFGAPEFTFDVRSRPVPARTTCAAATNLAVSYGLTPAGGTRRLTMSWAPLGGSEFRRFTSATYRRNGAGFRFDYASPFYPR